MHFFRFRDGDDAVMADLDRLQGRVWSFVAACPWGVTCEDIRFGLGLKGSTISPRLHELLELGRVCRAGLRKNRVNRHVTVWRAMLPRKSDPVQLVIPGMMPVEPTKQLVIPGIF